MGKVNKQEREAFSVYLRELIENSGKTKVEIENASGVKYLTRISSGDFLPKNCRDVIRLLEVLQCNTYEKNKMSSLYWKAKWGVNSWNTQKFIRETFSVLYWREQNLFHFRVKSGLPTADTLCGKLEVESCIKRVFQRVLEKGENGKIQICSEGSETQIFENIMSAFQKSKVVCEHIVYLPFEQNEEKFMVIKNIISSTVVVQGYNSVIQYFDGQNERTQIGLGKNIIITDDCVLYIIDQFQSCLILKSKEQVEVMRTLFKKNFDKGIRAIINWNEEQKKSVLKELLILDICEDKDTDKEASRDSIQYRLQYQIPIYRWFHIEKEEKQGNVTKVRLKKRVDKAKCCDYVSERGIEKFARSGKWFDVISGEKLQFEPSQVAMVLSELSRVEQKEDSQFLIVDYAQWEMEENLFLICREDGFNLFVISDIEGNKKALGVYEEGIGQSLVEWMKNFSAYDLTMEKKEQEEKLRGLLEGGVKN